MIRISRAARERSGPRRGLLDGSLASLIGQSAVATARPPGCGNCMSHDRAVRFLRPFPIPSACPAWGIPAANSPRSDAGGLLIAAVSTDHVANIDSFGGGLPGIGRVAGDRADEGREGSQASEVKRRSGQANARRATHLTIDFLLNPHAPSFPACPADDSEWAPVPFPSPSQRARLPSGYGVERTAGDPPAARPRLCRTLPRQTALLRAFRIRRACAYDV
jgi:hypothetical protein